MPLEGISSPGPLIPNNQIAEAAALGAFDSKVENSAPLKKTDEDETSANDQNLEENENNENNPAAADTKENLLPEILTKEKRNLNYTLNFNKYTELVELIDIKTGKVINKISPNDLIELISELKYTSVIFVDNEV